jgi:hypothetical protein
MIVDGYLGEWYETDEDSDSEVRNLLTAYREGYINDTFSLLYQKSNRSIRELEELIESYTAKNEAERRLITSIRQGINIINMNQNIFHYVCRPGENDENLYNTEDESVIEVERLIRFVYSGDDYLSESYLEYINTESMDCANEYFPRKSLVITPETDKLLEVDYVECFFTWLIEFIEDLYDYEDK